MSRTKTEQLTLRLPGGRPLPAPTSHTGGRSDTNLEFLLQESLRQVEARGCFCYVRARMDGGRHSVRRCGCRCGHKRPTGGKGAK